MNYTIKYVVLCEKGNKRKTNQDNFWCGGNFLSVENNGLSTCLTDSTNNATIPIFAIFDGMGGARYGETAAYIATKTLNSLCSTTDKSNSIQFLATSCKKMNDEICAYAKNNQAAGMGTTAVLLAFGTKNIYVCNIGDSKAFLYNIKTFMQISYDHVVSIPNAKKLPLSQHLGIPQDEFVINPYLATGEYNDGDRYLLCSDGLTDMVSMEEMESILSQKKPVADVAQVLMEAALNNGGSDNITIILCELHKNKFFKRKVLK